MQHTYIITYPFGAAPGYMQALTPYKHTSWVCMLSGDLSDPEQAFEDCLKHLSEQGTRQYCRVPYEDRVGRKLVIAFVERVNLEVYP